MNQTLENILELPLPQRLGVLAGALILVTAGFYFGFYSTSAEKLSELRDQIEGPNGLRVQIAQQRGIASHLEEFKMEVAALDVELKRALAQLPDSKEIPTLLSKISDKARDAGLDVRLFKPQAEAKQDFFARVPVQIEVDGTYHQVATFFDEVGHLDRIVNISEISLVEPNITDEAVTVKTSLVATAFRFLDESERPKENDEGGTANRRRRSGKPKNTKL